MSRRSQLLVPTLTSILPTATSDDLTLQANNYTSQFGNIATASGKLAATTGAAPLRCTGRADGRAPALDLTRPVTIHR